MVPIQIYSGMLQYVAVCCRVCCSVHMNEYCHKMNEACGTMVSIQKYSGMFWYVAEYCRVCCRVHVNESCHTMNEAH